MSRFIERKFYCAIRERKIKSLFTSGLRRTGPALRKALYKNDNYCGSFSLAGKRRIGLLGGSFNPAHGGHRRISLFARDALKLDEVWWLVSPGNPLKPRKGMAPLPARVGSAIAQARRAPIRVTAIERQLGTRYTVDTLAALSRRYPEKQFVWLMGSDNLAQFHRWRDWRRIARTMPIAVIARPGYTDAVVASPAMAWLRRFRVPLSSLTNGGAWSAPALVTLRFDPDSRSATVIRRGDPDWAARFAGLPVRDQLTHRSISAREETPAP